MPIALALGVEPGLPFVGGMPLPEGADESHFLGALFGEGIEVVPAETVDLMVPATAEIVIEGHIAFDETVMEGPMNEYPGYNALKLAQAGLPRHAPSPTATARSCPSSPPARRSRRTTPSSGTMPPPRSSTSSARPACRSPPRGSPTSPPCTG